MLHRLKSEDEGFTLIELLVVVLIIGILSAIALPTFLGQSDRAEDATAKGNVRAAQSKIEVCNTEQGAYTNCARTADLTTYGIPTTGKGGVTSVVASGTDYTLSGAGKGKTFTLRNNGGVITYACTPSCSW